MPPKKKANEPSKKTEQKKKEKIIEDKTFGLKNKKGAKQQKYIKTVVQQIQHGSQSQRKAEQAKQEKLSAKDRKKQQLDELNKLFKPVEQKVAKGVDAKSVLCNAFKAGVCTKGDKCKFSHDLNIARKVAKRSLYDNEEKENEDSMADWDEQKLEEVVNKKHGEKNKQVSHTKIICKYFLEAVENSKYGWFWECPNGQACIYKHCLPPGFELKKDKKAREEMKEVISLEELIERERAALDSDKLTKVTLESFLKWKERKRQEKKHKFAAEQNKKKSNFSQGKMFGISGREMFSFNPDLVSAADDDEADDTVYRREDEDEQTQKVKELDLAAMASMAQEADESGTKAKNDRLRKATHNGIASTPAEDESGKSAEASGGGDPVLTLADDTAIDENLFDGEDLDLIEDELETLEIE